MSYKITILGSAKIKGNFKSYNLTIAASPTPTPSKTPSKTISISVTPTVTITPTVTQTVTPTITVSNSVTPTVTVTTTVTPTITISNSVTPTLTPTVTQTVTPTLTPTVTPSITVSNSVTPTVTPTITVSNSVTPTLTPSVTPYQNWILASGNWNDSNIWTDGANWEDIDQSSISITTIYPSVNVIAPKTGVLNGKNSYSVSYYNWNIFTHLKYEVIWNGSQWQINQRWRRVDSDSEYESYFSSSNTTYPWEAMGWDTDVVITRYP